MYMYTIWLEKVGIYSWREKIFCFVFEVENFLLLQWHVRVFISPELKAQVSFSNCLLSVVRLSVIFSHFLFSSPESLG